MEDQDSSGQEVGGLAARVLNTGIALLHEGELVLPAAGSAAQAEQVIDDTQTVIHYYFPVEVEIRTTENSMNHEDIVETALLRLARGVRSLRG